MNPLIIRQRRPTEVNIVPLIDVLTVLIFFFLVMMQFREEWAMEIDLATIETAGSQARTNTVVIAIRENGELLMGGQPITLEALAERFKEASALNPQPAIHIFGDKRSPLEALTSIMDEARKAKLERVQIVADQ